MKSRSAKAKGNRLEREVAAAYRKFEVDETATRMPMSGAITHMKGDIHKRFDYEWVDECKQQERIQFWSWWGQATAQASYSQKPVLHISSNNRPVITCLRLEDYMALRAEVKQLRELVDKEE